MAKSAPARHNTDTPTDTQALGMLRHGWHSATPARRTEFVQPACAGTLHAVSDAPSGTEGAPVSAPDAPSMQPAGLPSNVLSLRATPWADLPSAETKLAMQVAANIRHESLPRWRRLLGAFIGYGEPYPAGRAK